MLGAQGTRTDADGRYRFDDVPPGEHLITVPDCNTLLSLDRVSVDAGARITKDFRC